ncbi:MAG: transcription termination factor Rho [Planctomycetales bacterium]
MPGPDERNFDDARAPHTGGPASVDSGHERGAPRSEGDGGGGVSNRRKRRRRRTRGGRPGQQPQPQQQPGRQRPYARRPGAGADGEEITGVIEGVLELHPKGYGFLRDPKKDYSAQEIDPFVSSSLIEKHRLREGVLLRGEVGSGTKGQGPRLKSVESVDGRTVEEYQKIRHFDELTAINPFEMIKLERGPRPITMRVMDLLTPIGKGQRALIVAPPRTGKTMLLQDIAESVSQNHPEVHLMVLLIDERPEEVTDMRRNVRGEVIASSMDRDVESHVRTSQLIIERAKRIAEAGGEVFVLLDSITRTARAFNKWVGNTGRTMSGGLDVKAMDIPKKMFGTARRFDEGGSLTVVATALIDTGSRMDEVIFQEFKGTGNMEMVLSRDLADRRIFPAIDIGLSGTRREEKILDPEVLDGIVMLRRSLVTLSSTEAMEQLIRTLERFPSNQEFLQKVRNVL